MWRKTNYAVLTVEYCSSDTLVLNCRDLEVVILVQTALYGRMSAGKCITSTYGESMGCHADVLAQLDDRCSGRPNCSMLVAVFDSLIQPCPRDFKSYLEISYECVPGCRNILRISKYIYILANKTGLMYNLTDTFVLWLLIFAVSCLSIAYRMLNKLLAVFK